MARDFGAAVLAHAWCSLHGGGSISMRCRNRCPRRQWFASLGVRDIDFVAAACVLLHVLDEVIAAQVELAIQMLRLGY